LVKGVFTRMAPLAATALLGLTEQVDACIQEQVMEETAKEKNKDNEPLGASKEACEFVEKDKNYPRVLKLATEIDAQTLPYADQGRPYTMDNVNHPRVIQLALEMMERQIPQSARAR